MPTYNTDVRGPRIVADRELEVAGNVLTGSEFEALDGVTAGTATASKALIIDANKDLATLRHLTISGNLVTGSTTLSEAELGVLDGLTASQQEIENAVDISTRLVAAGATLTLTAAAHSDRVILLDTASGSAITLPAASGSGAKFTFVVSVKPTTNQHRISVVGDDEFVGSVNNLDMDAATQSAFAALDAADNDQFDMNGTTKGGQVGDWVELIDYAADNWHIRGQLVCPAGSNPATSFATGQVS